MYVRCVREYLNSVYTTHIATKLLRHGLAMAQAVSRRSLTTEARVRSQDKVAPGQVFFTSTSVFPCQFQSTGVPLQGKTKKINHLRHRVAQ